MLYREHRHAAIRTSILIAAPHQFEPIHCGKANGDVDPHPWCQGFYAAIRLRPSAWAPLLNVSNGNHGLLPAAVEPMRQYWMPIHYVRAPLITADVETHASYG